ncbi:MAG TPA: hypothetical protein VKP60_02830 [Magnetospirillaceae bacterium]|nr:hypothetical protein [Magnetospirillaceae bacterium]
MMRAATFLWALLATIAGAGLFLLKYQVQAEERHLREVRKDIVGTEQSIHVLKAEWSYLNDPLRLREQAERHLAMHPMRANQMVSIETVPMLGDGLYQPPGLLPMKKDPAVGHKPDAKKPAAATAAIPTKKPLPAGRTMTAKLVKPAAAGKRPTEVANGRLRP